MSITDIFQICRIWKTFFISAGLLLSFVSKQTVYVASAEGNIGCLFAESLCIPHLEWCYDDFAFGKCLPQYGLEPEELFREPLDKNEIKILHAMLEELEAAGLGWQDPYVQCRIQSALDALRLKADIPESLCAPLAPPHILNSLLSQRPEGFIRFSPPRNKFDNDIYYPPLHKKNNFPARAYSDDETMQPDLPLTSSRHHHQQPAAAVAAPRLSPQNLEVLQNFLQPVRPVVDQREEKLRKLFEDLTQSRGAAQQHYEQPPPVEYADYGEGPLIDNNYPLVDKEASHFKERQELLDGDSVKELLEELTYPRTSFREVSQSYHIPQQHLFAPETNADYEEEVGEPQLPNEHGIYTEGGVVYPEQDSYDSKEEARNFLADMLGFTRHERLDVKKPGPVVIVPTDINKTEESEASLKTKKAPRDDKAPHVVDTDFAHVRLKNPIDSWSEGQRIVSLLGQTLKMEQYFSKVRVDRHEVSFFVESNPDRKTAADVAKLINDGRLKASIFRRTGFIIEGAGVGDKTKINEVLPSSERLMKRLDDTPDVTHVMAYMFAGAGAAAAMVIIITLFLIKRHDKKKDKLSGLPTGITGAESCSKDYQELCRARMAGKGTPAEGGRITALSKESERAPSSRSSTSSWNEEPALTNMDISTGHMVLSYMEDHCSNKDRLEREWDALCRYEAEPNARDAATQPECNILNRNRAPLPFDHSRVVLNHLANAEGMDYINASTITDHDPRAPAYVAAQGPLPTTIAHFWQMVWEQGAVVIVALCKLEENGQNMCSRYWPEEGSETYHIYEVHLVSEHIWCEDYLVRSFYLKNIKTAETRTVTQFHFLSWPQGGVPASAKALLEFRRKVNKSYRGRSCPIVVHSSNGAGRAGAYILIDLVLGRMNKGAREIDIAATLEHLRDQRSGVVETRQQFVFVLTTVAEEVHQILKALPQQQSGEKKEIEKEPSKDEADPKNNKETKTNNKTDKPEKAETSKKSSANNSEPTTTTASTKKDDTKK